MKTLLQMSSKIEVRIGLIAVPIQRDVKKFNSRLGDFFTRLKQVGPSDGFPRPKASTSSYPGEAWIQV